MNWLRRNWVFVLPAVALLGWLALSVRSCGREERPTVSPPIVIQPDSVVVRNRPTTKPPTLGQRIVTRPVPVTRIVSAGTPDTIRVRAFARKVFEAESLRAVIRRLRLEGRTAAADSVSRETPPPVLPPTSGKYDGKRLTLWLSRSDGSVMQATARLRPRWSFVAGAGGVSDTLPLVREDRWWLRQAREVPGCLPATGAGGAAGVLLAKDDLAGLALGALLGLAACLSD